MSVITAYKCDATGKLFEDKKKYQTHIRKIAAERRRQRKIDEAAKSDQMWWADNFWNKVQSIAQLRRAIIVHADVFAARGVKNSWYGPKFKLQPTPVVDITVLKLPHSDLVSNSHAAPHNGVTNWGGKKLLNNGEPAPTGYPGWRGRIDYIVQTYKGQTGCYPGSGDMWKGTRIHTGTGGGGHTRVDNNRILQSFGFDICLYEADWPALAAAYAEANLERDKALQWYLLKNNGSSWGFDFDCDAWVNQKYPADGYK